MNEKDSSVLGRKKSRFFAKPSEDHETNNLSDYGPLASQRKLLRNSQPTNEIDKLSAAGKLPISKIVLPKLTKFL